MSRRAGETTTAPSLRSAAKTTRAGRRRLGALAGIAASAVACALYARVAWPWVLLGWCALVPWLATLSAARTLRSAVLSGLAMCEAFTIAVFFWFGDAIAAYTGAPRALGGAVLVAIAPLIQGQFVAYAAARFLAARSGAGRWRLALTGAAAYVGAEWVVPKLFGDTFGHGLYASSLWRQAADLTGAPGLTFALVLGNECLWAAAHAWRHDPPARRRAGVLAPLAVVLGLAAMLSGYGVWANRRYAPAPEPPVRAGIVQADIAHYDELARSVGTYDAVQTILDAYFALSAQLAAPPLRAVDLLIWPETVYPTTFGAPKSDDGAAFDRAIAAFVQRAGVPLVFGSYARDGADEFNAAVFLEAGGTGSPAFASYRKASLFPLTERVPSALDSPRLRRWFPWLGTWKPGQGTRVVTVRLAGGRRIPVAPLICYDAVDPRLAIDAVRAGAELIVTLSNDSWFAGGGGPRLHLVVSAFRSIETRRPQLRATNTGISAAITATGELLGEIGVDQRAARAVAVVPERTAQTLMLRWGSWFGPAAALLAAVLVAAALRAAHPTARPNG